jgi:hypothetical protein
MTTPVILTMKHANYAQHHERPNELRNKKAPTRRASRPKLAYAEWR